MHWLHHFPAGLATRGGGENIVGAAGVVVDVCRRTEVGEIIDVERVRKIEPLTQVAMGPAVLR
jgi:hypothetical protein